MRPAPRSIAACATLRGRRARVAGKSDAFTSTRAIPDARPVCACAPALPATRPFAPPLSRTPPRRRYD
ncbi:hypothetical protein [Achromobacter xylosoxidans]|uniref:hypothetical protein n=1 Tax=Alcaligenes xylosoxydans xylosoxydans TaxID=85698 RepID=UPI001EEAE28E|nr:hypothetical protein [Achromobacter xylosoxidans]